MSVSDEARAEVNGLKASRYFSLAEKLSVGATPFIWLFIRPPWSLSGSCCKAVVHESLRAECQLQGVSSHWGDTMDPGSQNTRCHWEKPLGRLWSQTLRVTSSFLLQAHKASILHCLGRVLSLFEVCFLSLGFGVGWSW